MLLESIFFLPTYYVISLLASGVITGLILSVGRKFLLMALLLFTLFSFPQLVFRFNEDADPGRLVGQYLYFTGYLLVAGITMKLKGGRQIFIP